MKYARVYGSALLGLAGVIAPAALAATPPALTAPSQLLFEWSGRVDKEIRVSMRGQRAYVDRVGDRETTNGRVYTANGLPRENARIYVERLEGRGRVDVVQQPTRANNYTAIIRVRDPQSGASNYWIRAYTTASAYDDRTGPGNNGRGWGWGRNKHKHKDKDRDGRYEDRDDRRRDRDRDDDRDDGNDRRDRNSRGGDDARNQMPNWPW